MALCACDTVIAVLSLIVVVVAMHSVREFGESISFYKGQAQVRCVMGCCVSVVCDTRVICHAQPPGESER